MVLRAFGPKSWDGLVRLDIQSKAVHPLPILMRADSFWGSDFGNRFQVTPVRRDKKVREKCKVGTAVAHKRKYHKLVRSLVAKANRPGRGDRPPLWLGKRVAHFRLGAVAMSKGQKSVIDLTKAQQQKLQSEVDRALVGEGRPLRKDAVNMKLSEVQAEIKKKQLKRDVVQAKERISRFG